MTLSEYRYQMIISSDHKEECIIKNRSGILYKGRIEFIDCILGINRDTSIKKLVTDDLIIEITI